MKLSAVVVVVAVNVDQLKSRIEKLTSKTPWTRLSSARENSGAGLSLAGDWCRAGDGPLCGGGARPSRLRKPDMVEQSSSFSS